MKEREREETDLREVSDRLFRMMVAMVEEACSVSALPERSTRTRLWQLPNWAGNTVILESAMYRWVISSIVS